MPSSLQAPRPRVRTRARRRQRPSAPVGVPFGKHIYAQVIDDAKGVTLASASSLEKDIQGPLKTGATRPPPRRQAHRRARQSKAGVKDVVFDRGGYIYHGRVKALADAAREGGLNF
jgi:large subunit ribosomal protein L18